MTDTEAALSIGDVAARVGISVHTLRFYEREGILVHPVRRGTGGHRVYSDNDVRWLEICLKFRSSGMPLPAIRRYAELVREGPGNEKERLALLREHRDHVEGQIRDLTDALDVIGFKVDYYQARLDEGTAETLWNPVDPRDSSPT